jgi:hypothetical protein
MRRMSADAEKILKPLVYVSYAWGEDDTDAGRELERIVDELCDALEKYDGIIVGRDKRRQEIGDSIEGFAADIARADIVLAVVSRKCLRSYHCMVEELHQAYRRTNYAREEFRKKACLLLMDDGRPDIHVSQDLIDHWLELYEEMNSRLQQSDAGKTKSPHAWAALENIKEMKSRMFDMLSALTDTVMPRGYAEITRNDFEELRDLIRRRLEEWRRWREDRSGLIPGIDEGSLEAAKTDAEKPPQQFLALVLERGVDLVDDPDWAHRECPWEVRSYRWESLLFTPQQGSYQPVDLQADISPYLIADGNVGASTSTGDQRSSFRDLLQAAVKWIDKQQSAALVLELFVPTELLVFDWSSIKIPGRSEYDDDECLYAWHPYVLRSVDRFREDRLRSGRSQLQLKYEALSAGRGRWIAGLAAANPDVLKESVIKPELVALKCLATLNPEPLMRLRWHRRVVEAMMPLALWWRCRDDGSEDGRQKHEAELREHLDQAYEGLLSGHNDGDQVQRDCHHLEELPRLRRGAISNPLTRDLVLLVDHPDRHPWPQPDQPQGSSVRSA